MFPDNKLHKVFPDLKECVICPRTNRKEETVMARLHIRHSFFTLSFLLKGEEPPMCIGCDERLTIEHILLDVRILLKQQRAILQLSQHALRVLFEEISMKRICNYLKAIKTISYI